MVIKVLMQWKQNNHNTNMIRFSCRSAKDHIISVVWSHHTRIMDWYCGSKEKCYDMISINWYDYGYKAVLWYDNDTKKCYDMMMDTKKCYDMMMDINYGHIIPALWISGHSSPLVEPQYRIHTSWGNGHGGNGHGGSGHGGNGHGGNGHGGSVAAPLPWSRPSERHCEKKNFTMQHQY